MTPGRIAELLKPFLSENKLTRENLQSISIYIDLLLRWNARVNLTAIRDPEEIVSRHFGESFFAARHLFPKPAEHTEAIDGSKDSPGLVDVGSGAGFPGLPIKLWAPQISLTLVELNQKKATFLREVCRSLSLKQANVRNMRAESFSVGAFDVATLRAVERFEDTLPTAGRLLVKTGRLALLISSKQVEIAQSILSNLSWARPILIPQSMSRILLLGTKES
jgi:16S rRNA (guanine527-N7)-methyltransferase